MASKVVALRLPQPLYDALVLRADATGFPTLSSFVLAQLQGIAEGTPLTIETTAQADTQTGATDTAAFFRVATLSGVPEVCPRCGSRSAKPIHSYERSNGGTWSCPFCQAHGKWYVDRPATIDHLGARLTQWQADRDAFENRER